MKQLTRRDILRKSLSCSLALLLAGWLLCTGFAEPRLAYADPDNTTEVPNELQQAVESTADEYNAAIKKLDDLETQIADNQNRIKDLEESIPAQQQKASDAARALYKIQQEGYSLINMILDTGSIHEFISTVEYVNQIQTSNINEISRLKNMKAELETTKGSLLTAKEEALVEKLRAEDALKNAQNAREEYQRRAQEAVAAQAAKQQQATAATGGAPAEPTPPSGGDPIDWSTDKAAFVNGWAARIDAYLAGSPMAGKGRAFAEAAWNYGVDPRWSPAISNTESSKGLHCFRPYNAWGWGQVSWSSWDEAIDAHVRGLARGYGGTITVAAAQKYCPPNWQHWYDATLSQMNTI